MAEGEARVFDEGLAAAEASLTGESQVPSSQDLQVTEQGSVVEDEAIQVVRDFANHPMMDRVQKTLVETLRREYERVEVEAREKVREANAEKRNREDLGVELYGAQQHLARLQLNLEAAHNKALELQEMRDSEEAKASKARSEHAGLKSALVERTTLVARNQAELDAINETLRQVERYNEEMEKEIAITKRATYKAEETVTSLENSKRDQDLYIDSMQERAKKLEETIAMHQAQLDRQREESTEANQMLTETGREMELIVFEKKQLVQQWKSSLIQLAKRDEALAAANASLESTRVELQDLQTEVEVCKREAVAAQADYETLASTCEKHKKDEAQLVERLRDVSQEHEALSAQMTLLQRSAAHTQEEERKVLAESKSSGDSIDQLSANIQIVTVERQKIEQKIAAARSAQTTVSKAVKSLRKQTEAVREKAFALELEEANLENEMGRVHVDSVNTKAHNDQLRETLDDMDQKLREQDSLIARYQQEIRQRNDDIEKKMARVDRLNRKYEKMMAEAADDGDVHLGPLEATVKNLSKELDAINAESQTLQAKWLSDQTKLVHTAQAAEGTLEKNAELRARVRILDEKRLKLLKESAKHASQINALQSNNKTMRSDVARLNDLLGRHSAMEQSLINETSAMETDFKSELKELEEVSLSAEQKVAQARAAKAQLLDEVVEVERQVLLWEKKIQLERETQAALDPEVGSSEVKAMEMEIHRMKIRLNGLQNEQEVMIKEMERAILKKEGYALRYKGAQRPSMLDRRRIDKQQSHTKASLKKQIFQLKRTIQQTANDATQLSVDIDSRQRDIETITDKLDQSTSRYGELEREGARLQAEINSHLYEKQRRTEMQNARDRTVARYLDLERGAVSSSRPLSRNADGVRRDLDAATEQNATIRNVISSLLTHFDYLSEPLDRIMRLAEDAMQPAVPRPEDSENLFSSNST